jgi:hypothetical protein
VLRSRALLLGVSIVLLAAASARAQCRVEGVVRLVDRTPLAAALLFALTEETTSSRYRQCRNCPALAANRRVCVEPHRPGGSKLRLKDDRLRKGDRPVVAAEIC